MTCEMGEMAQQIEVPDWMTCEMGEMAAGWRVGTIGLCVSGHGPDSEEFSTCAVAAPVENAWDTNQNHRATRWAGDTRLSTI